MKPILRRPLLQKIQLLRSLRASTFARARVARQAAQQTFEAGDPIRGDGLFGRRIGPRLRRVRHLVSHIDQGSGFAGRISGTSRRAAFIAEAQTGYPRLMQRDGQGVFDQRFLVPAGPGSASATFNVIRGLDPRIHRASKKRRVCRRRQSYEDGWMRGSSPRMTLEVGEGALRHVVAGPDLAGLDVTGLDPVMTTHRASKKRGAHQDGYYCFAVAL